MTSGTSFEGIFGVPLATLTMKCNWSQRTRLKDRANGEAWGIWGTWHLDTAADTAAGSD